MSHTPTRPRRLARLAAGLTVAAATTATTLLGAAPAYAQTNGITVSKSGGSMIVVGSSFDDVITATGSGTVRISTNRQVTTILSGCVSFGQVAECTGVTLLSFSGGTGNDRFTNNVPARIRLNGDAGDDTLFGGTRDDQLIGGSGTDEVHGRGGRDQCLAEVEFTCEI